MSKVQRRLRNAPACGKSKVLTQPELLQRVVHSGLLQPLDQNASHAPIGRDRHCLTVSLPGHQLLMQLMHCVAMCCTLCWLRSCDTPRALIISTRCASLRWCRPACRLCTSTSAHRTTAGGHQEVLPALQEAHRDCAGVSSNLERVPSTTISYAALYRSRACCRAAVLGVFKELGVL